MLLIKQEVLVLEVNQNLQGGMAESKRKGKDNQLSQHRLDMKVAIWMLQISKSYLLMSKL